MDEPLDIPIPQPLLQQILDYMTKGSTPRCTFIELNQLVSAIMTLANGGELEPQTPEVKPNGAAPEHRPTE